MGSLSVHLDGWQDANCPTVYFIVEQRERGTEEWSSVSRSAKPGADIVISNLSPATWYQIKVTGERPLPDPTSLEFEIATHAVDGSGFSGCVIEKNVKYSGYNLDSKRGINQETCALLCFKKPSCTHWIQGTPLPRAQGGVRAASHPGFGMYLTGIDRSVLSYMRWEDGVWVEEGTTKEGFWMHSTVAGDLARLCH